MRYLHEYLRDFTGKPKEGDELELRTSNSAALYAFFVPSKREGVAGFWNVGITPPEYDEPLDYWDFDRAACVEAIEFFERLRDSLDAE